MAQCEIKNCTNLTDSYLCDEHQQKAQNPYYMVLICEKCYSIPNIIMREDSKEPYKRNKQFKFIPKCHNCLPWSTK